MCGDSLPLLYSQGVDTIGGLAVDPTIGNLYVTDASKGRILVCTNWEVNCAVLLENLTQPMEIVVDGQNRYVFHFDKIIG